MYIHVTELQTFIIEK